MGRYYDTQRSGAIMLRLKAAFIMLALSPVPMLASAVLVLFSTRGSSMPRLLIVVGYLALFCPLTYLSFAKTFCLRVRGVRFPIRLAAGCGAAALVGLAMTSVRELVLVQDEGPPAVKLERMNEHNYVITGLSLRKAPTLQKSTLSEKSPYRLEARDGGGWSRCAPPAHI